VRGIVVDDHGRCTPPADCCQLPSALMVATSAAARSQHALQAAKVKCSHLPRRADHLLPCLTSSVGGVTNLLVEGGSRVRTLLDLGEIDEVTPSSHRN
jgi:riboflavin biosynthesis pyrimidine reductase